MCRIYILLVRDENAFSVTCLTKDPPIAPLPAVSVGPRWLLGGARASADSSRGSAHDSVCCDRWRIGPHALVQRRRARRRVARKGLPSVKTNRIVAGALLSGAVAVAGVGLGSGTAYEVWRQLDATTGAGAATGNLSACLRVCRREVAACRRVSRCIRRCERRY